MDDLYDMFGEGMYESEDLFDLENVYQLPVNMVLHLKSREEPLFVEHVFYFEKEDPVTSLEELMNFIATWWNAVTEDKNVTFLFLTDRFHNKKAVLAEDIAAASFMTPDKPEWMDNGKDNSDPD